MEKYLMGVSVLIMLVGGAFFVDAVAAWLADQRPKLGIYPSAIIAFSGMTSFVFAKILTVLKDIRKAVTRP
jgi:hypothetical protein